MDVRLCPFCMNQYEPNPDFPECPRCGSDTSSRAPVDMDEESYWERPRRQCLYCGQEILEGATVCGSCRAFVPE